jgi:vanillate monooxygenase
MSALPDLAHLPRERTFLKRAWYVACTADELQGPVPVGRRICDQAVVLFRDSQGQAQALDDWCPHRGAPLSMGRVEGDSLVCAYHGLRMGCDGRTVAMPGQRVHAFPAIRRHAVAEYAGFVWLWAGDAADANLSLLPRLPWADEPGWAYGGGCYHIACDYRLMIDNLMDLTHETYVHASSIGQREIDEVPCRSRVQGNHVITERHMHGVMAPPFWQDVLRMNSLPADEAVDRWQVCHFEPPSQVMIEAGVALAGQGGIHAPDDQKAASWVVDFITPETEHSIWYFWGMARRFRADDAELTAQIREGQGRIFSEDRAVLEAQQRNHLAWPQRRVLNLNIDAGGVAARRVIERLLAAEREAELAAAQAS